MIINWQNCIGVLYGRPLTTISVFLSYFADCDENSTQSFGHISSHNFLSHPISQNVVCRYKLTAPVGKLIQITFLSHPDLTSSDDCYHGSLRIYEDEEHDTALDTPAVQYCSSRKACHKTYLSNGGSLLLIYTSTYSYVPFMFKLVYRHISGKGDQMCGNFIIFREKCLTLN